VSSPTEAVVAWEEPVERRRTGTQPSEWKVVLSLTRAESRRLLHHPVIFVGLALSTVLFGVGRDVSPETVTHHWYSGSIGATYMNLCGGALLWLALAALISSNLGVLRSRRDRADETYRSLPAGAGARTAAQLLALAWPFAISAVLVAAAFRYVGAGDGLFVDYSGRKVVPSGFELAQGPLVVLVLGVLGVALAVWVPRFSVTLVVAFAIFAIEWIVVVWSASVARSHWMIPLADPAKYTRATAHFPPGSPAEDGLAGFDVAGAGWHLLYLAALAAVLAALALLRGSPGRRLFPACAVALAVLFAAALPQLWA
jgi:hypothetical protein